MAEVGSCARAVQGQLELFSFSSTPPFDWVACARNTIFIRHTIATGHWSIAEQGQSFTLVVFNGGTFRDRTVICSRLVLASSSYHQANRKQTRPAYRAYDSAWNIGGTTPELDYKGRNLQQIVTATAVSSVEI